MTCNDCDLEVSEVSIIDGRVICPSCREDNGFICEDCASESHTDNSHLAIHGMICDSCYENYFYCNECNQLYHIDNMSSTDLICINCEDEDDDEEYEDDEECKDSWEEINGADYVHDIKYGLELETVGSSNFNSNWKKIYDGSIEPEGNEFCSPVFKGNCEEAIENFLRKTNGLSVNKTCGYHLHLESRDFTSEELKKIYILACNLEDWIFSIVSPSRRDNRYCRKLPKKIYESPDTNFIFDEEWYETQDSYSRKREKYDATRYYWVNFHSHYFRGTIEIRLHQGTLNKNKIVNWIKLWLLFFKFCKDNSLQTIKDTKEPNFITSDLKEYYKQRQDSLIVEEL